ARIAIGRGRGGRNAAKRQGSKDTESALQKRNQRATGCHDGPPLPPSVHEASIERPREPAVIRSRPMRPLAVPAGVSRRRPPVAGAGSHLFLTEHVDSDPA